MIRRAFTVASPIPLVLCAMTAIAWYGSFHGYWTISEWVSGWEDRRLVVSDGEMRIERQRPPVGLGDYFRPWTPLRVTRVSPYAALCVAALIALAVVLPRLRGADASQERSVIRCAFTLGAALSLLLTLLMGAAIAWGIIAPTQYFWARGGTFHQLVISRGLLRTSWMGGWPRDEPMVHVVATGQLHVMDRIPAYRDWRCPLGGEDSVDARIYAAVGMQRQPLDPWGHDSPETFSRMSSIWINLRRCLVPAALLPAAWLVSWLLPRRGRQGRGFLVMPGHGKPR